MMHVISLGAGVQSSTMALMASHGDLTPMPAMAIFADTQDEPASVYKWLDFITPKLAFPVVHVSIGKLSLAALTPRVSKKGGGYLKPALPTYLSNHGHMQRHCTADFKITPIQRYLRLIRGTERVTEWLGISMDEQLRQTVSTLPWCGHRYPLIELKMSRDDCQQWLVDHGYPMAPRSACRYCPFHSEDEWLRLKTDEPDEFAAAVKFEKDFQAATLRTALREIPYLHDSRQPLDTIDFAGIVAAGNAQGELFTGECKGRCGV